MVFSLLLLLVVVVMVVVVVVVVGTVIVLVAHRFRNQNARSRPSGKAVAKLELLLADL